MKNNTYTFSQFALAEQFDPNADFELLHTGANTDTRYGEFRFSKDDLEGMAKNFNDGVRGVEIAVDINHDPQKRAYAWIQPGSMHVAPSSKIDGEYSLYGKIHRYTSDGEKMMREGAYRYFSLEIIGSLSAMVGKVKKTFKNVITGLALTNTPVIKGLKAIYSENLLPNTHNMKEFNALVTELLQKGHATLSEKEQAADLFVALSGEQQTQLQTKLSELDSLPEDAKKEPEVAPTAPEAAPEAAPVAPVTPPVETPAAPATDTALAEVPEAKHLAESLRLAEENKTLSEKVAQLTQSIRSEKAAKQASSLMLSESNAIGIPAGKDNESRLKTLLVSLSEEQAAEVVALFSEVRTVDFKEHGKNVGEMSLAEREDLMDSKADELMAKNPKMAKHEALAAAAKALSLDKE